MKENIILYYFKMGGPFMYPLLFFLISAFYFIFDRIITYSLYDWKVYVYIDKILKNAKEESIKTTNSFVNFLSINFKKFRDKKEKFDNYMEIDCRKLLEHLEKNLIFLNAISTLAPIVGFLGTVWGMVIAFQKISGSTEVTPQLAAKGIYQALITTTFGLMITVFTSVFFFVFTAFITRYSSRMEDGVNKVNLYLEGNTNESKKK